MPRIEIVSGGKRVPIYYELHGPCQTDDVGGRPLPRTERAGRVKAQPAAGGGESPAGPVAGAHAGQGRFAPLAPEAAKQRADPWEHPADVAVDCTTVTGGDREPEKVLVIGGLGAKASTAWCAHIVQHLVGLRGAQGQSLACVCTYDLRGCGESYTPASPSEYRTHLMAGDALGLMDALGWGKAHVWGWSIGAQVAAKLAANHPDRLASCTLFGCTVRGGEFLLSPTILTPSNCGAMLLGLCWSRPKHRASLERFFTKEWLSQEVVHEGRRETRFSILMENCQDPSRPNRCMDKNQTSRGRMGQQQAAVRYRLRRSEVKAIAGSGVPMLVVNGFHDTMSPHRFASKLCRKLRCTLVATPAAHVGVLIEQAALSLEVLERQVFGRCLTTLDQRMRVQRQAEQGILSNSFQF